jgi:transposase
MISRKGSKSVDHKRQKSDGLRRCTLSLSAMAALDRWVDKRPDVTLKHMAEMLQSEFGIFVSKETISIALDKLNFSVKLLRQIPVASNTDKNIQKRYEYASKFLDTAPLDLSRIV